MVEEKILNNTQDEILIIRNVLMSKLKNLAKKYFQVNSEEIESNSAVFSQLSKFFKASVNEYNTEIFIDFNSAPVFWCYNSNLIKYLQSKFKPLYKNIDRVEDQKTLFDLYSRWVFSTSLDDKKFLANLIIRIIGRNDNLNLLNQFLASVVFAYQESLFNPAKSLKILSEVKQNLSRIELEKKYEDEFKYLILLFEAFYYLKLEDNNNASIKITEACASNSLGINCRFYTIVTDCNSIDEDELRRALYEIASYDLERIGFAIESNNYGLYQLFLESNVFKKIFQFSELSPFTSEIESLLEELELDFDSKWNLLIQRFEELKKLNIEQYENDQIARTVEFLSKIIDLDVARNNVFFKGSIGNLHNKFNNLLKLIEQQVINKHNYIIENGLQVFRYNIKKTQEKFGKLKIDLDSKLEKLKKTIENSIKQTETQYDQLILNLQNKIDNFDFGRSYDPSNSFRNAVTSTVIFSAVVFFIAGFASFSNVNNSGVDKSISIFLIPGMKWGAVAFLFGTLMAIGSAVSTWFERQNYKTRLNQKLKNIKSEKENKIQKLINSGKSDEELLQKSYQDQVDYYNQSIEKLKTDMAKTQEDLTKDVNEKISEEVKPYLSLFIDKK